jgi:diphthine synthase
VALHLVGLGLHDASDISVKGLERVRGADAVYAEFYTAILGGTPHAELERFLGRPVKRLDRLGVEKGGKDLVEQARANEVVLLTAGDPLTATTHTDLVVRAHAAGVAVHVVHGASIYSAAPGLLGLQHYKFGRTTTLVRPEPNWFPTSPFDAVAENHARGLHTLVLLDIKADEDYFMTANDGLRLLLELAQRTGAAWFTPTTQAGVVARAGSRACVRRTGPIAALLGEEFGPPLHCIVIPGDLQVVEEEAWRILA